MRLYAQLHKTTNGSLARHTFDVQSLVRAEVIDPCKADIKDFDELKSLKNLIS